MCTASAAKLQEHVESKHSKNGFAVCIVFTLCGLITSRFAATLMCVDAGLFSRQSNSLAAMCMWRRFVWYSITWTDAIALQP